jgi:NAD(P)-dependent dehydrogenase (short-subunit alcohol dehydrogenase family)
MDISSKVAVVTGAGSGIGKALVSKLVLAGVRAVACVDLDEEVKNVANGIIAIPFVGDVCNQAFRQHVFDAMTKRYAVPSICVPAAGITKDGLAVKLDKESGKAQLYSVDAFRTVLEVNLTAPTYWIMEMVGRLAEKHGRWEAGQELRGTGVMIGSVSSQGNRGQIAYAATKKAAEAVAATLSMEAMFYGVKVGVVHPGYTDTPMVRRIKDWETVVAKNVLPSTQLKRLIRVEEVADAVVFMIANSAVSGQIWADAGFHPAP